MLLKNVIGLHETKEKMVQMVQQNRLSHAIMIVGKEGSGGLPLALAFASYIVCLGNGKAEKKTETASGLFGPEPEPEIEEGPLDPDTIEALPAYQKASKLIHPDIHFSIPAVINEKLKKRISNDYMPEWREFVVKMPYGNIYDWLQFIGADNKQGNLSAEECNDIVRKLSLKSFESPWKVLIMWMPEYLGKEGNKLLKLIEEPPPGTLFLLVAENEEAVLSTILSRCQMIRLPMPENIDVENALVERAGLEREKARQISLISDGNYREALSLLQNNEEDWLSILRQWLNAAIKGGPKMQIEWISLVNELGREKQKQFLRYFVHLLEQSLRIRILSPNRLSLPPDEMDFAQRLNKIAGINQQEALVKELEQASYYIERNANAKMLFHALTLKLRSIVLEKTVILSNN